MFLNLKSSQWINVLLVLLASQLPSTTCFHPTIHNRKQSFTTTVTSTGQTQNAWLSQRTTRLFAAAPSYENDYNNNNKDDIAFWSSLRQRTSALVAKEKKRRFAKCKTSEINFQQQQESKKEYDNIRRIDMDQYPLVACGSADGSLYVANLETEEIVASEIGFHRRFGGDEDAMKLMHGDFDGGGVLAVVMKGNLLVSSGREGGAKVWRIKDDGTGELLFMGDVVALHRQTVTSLQFDDENGKLWAGTYDGKVYAFDYENVDTRGPLSVQTPVTVMDMGSPVLSISIAAELGCGVCATSKGGVKIFWLEESAKPTVFASWYPFASPSKEEEEEEDNENDDEETEATMYAQSAIILQNKQSDSTTDTATSWSIVCGAKDGTIYTQTLNVDSFGSMCADNPFHGTPGKSLSTDETSLQEQCHTAPVVCLAPVFSSSSSSSSSSGGGGLLVSGSQDGTMRVWDWTANDDAAAGTTISNSETSSTSSCNDLHCLYAFSHKGYLGSICSDGSRLVSDGSDNAIMVHDFTVVEEEEEDADNEKQVNVEQAVWPTMNSNKEEEKDNRNGEEESVWE